MSTEGPKEKVVGSVELPDLNSKEVMGAIRGMKAITATSIATRFNLKISVAKRMLDMMEESGTVKMVARSSNLKVYAMTDSKEN
jgi:ribosomal protein S25